MVMYFVHFTFVNNTGKNGDGNIDVGLTGDISAAEDVRLIEKKIREGNNYASVVVTNFIKLSDE